MVYVNFDDIWKLEANQKGFYLKEKLTSVYFKHQIWFGYIFVVYQLKLFNEPISNREHGQLLWNPASIKTEWSNSQLCESKPQQSIDL